MAYGVGRAIQDGIARASALAAEDHAHEVGQRYYQQRLAQRKAEVRADGKAALAELVALRKRLHG
ncbi:hypothetical protein [Devosia submarina]|uniref:hypothetical protein n=1 Tax=Devosia submarina TaxID=1173082 RepID=UPI0013006D40|nr:hypothetical protein [Devosia submarina]